MFWSNKNIVKKKIINFVKRNLIEKSFGQNIFGFKKYFGRKYLLVKKSFSQKSLLVETNFGQKTFVKEKFHQKNFGS